jgi:hypothetical protein
MWGKKSTTTSPKQHTVEGVPSDGEGPADSDMCGGGNSGCAGPAKPPCDRKPPLCSETSRTADVYPASGAAVEAATTQSSASSAEDLSREYLEWEWEDTKQWVRFMRQSRGKEQCLQDLQIDEQTFTVWYMGTSRPPHITV